MVGSSGSTTFGGEALAGPGFIARLDAQGNHIYSRTVDAFLRATALARGGGPVIAGYFSRTITLGNDTLSSKVDGGGLVASLDERGAVRWARALTDDAGRLSVSSVAVGPDDTVLVLGSYRPPPAQELFPNPPFQEGFFLAKLDEGGRELWRRQVGGAQIAMARGMALDAQGNASVVVAGAGGTIDFSGVIVEPSERNHLLLARFDGNGRLLWVKGVSESNLENIEALAAGPEGAVYAAGYAATEALGQPYRAEFAVSRFDATGARTWRQRFSIADQHDGAAVVPNPCGGLIATTNARGSTGATLVVAIEDTGKIKSQQTLRWPEYRRTTGVVPGGANTAYIFGSIGEQTQDMFLTRISM
jgi:outer membrane protein assembly factor BamB